MNVNIFNAIKALNTVGNFSLADLFVSKAALKENNLEGSMLKTEQELKKVRREYFPANLLLSPEVRKKVNSFKFKTRTKLKVAIYKSLPECK